MTQAIQRMSPVPSPWKGWIRAVARWMEARRQRRQLLTLSDATLRDLGLTRSDIERAFMDMPRGPLDDGR